MRAAAAIHAPDMIIHQIPIEDTTEDEELDVKTVIDGVKSTGYRFIYAIVFTPEIHDALIAEAYEQGVAGTGLHTWLFGATNSNAVLTGRTFVKGSPQHLGYQGSALLEVSGGVPGIEAYDKYTQSMEQLLNPTDLEYMASIVPQYPDFPEYASTPIMWRGDFLRPIKSGFSPFMYEAVAALALAACDEYEVNPAFTGVDHYQRLKNTTFTGISGTVNLDNTTGTRDPSSALYKVANYVAREEVEEGETVIRFEAVISSLLQSGEWVEQVPYVFNDGTNNLPADLGEQSDSNNKGIIAGVAVAGAVLLAVIGYLLYENKRRENDMLWEIKKDEIDFGETPTIIGSGSFGSVLLAEYRGTA